MTLYAIIYFFMHRIEYMVNGGSTTNTVYAFIIAETPDTLLISINGELERSISKDKIISKDPIPWKIT